jgi:hypothetical protein
VDTLGDRVHASAGKTLLDKLDDGFLEYVFAGLFRIVLTTLARCLGGHGALTASVMQAVIMGRDAA